MSVILSRAKGLHRRGQHGLSNRVAGAIMAKNFGFTAYTALTLQQVIAGNSRRVRELAMVFYPH